MGNCQRTSSNKVLAYEEEQEPKMELARSLLAPQEIEPAKDIAKRKKRVRFRLEEEEEAEKEGDRGGYFNNNNNNNNNNRNRNGVVRIRMVVTQEELKQILDYKKSSDSKFTSLEQLLSEMKLRGRSILEVEKNDDYWSPTLETIPEDHIDELVTNK